MSSNSHSDCGESTRGAFSDKILHRLARKVGDEWKEIAIELDFTMAEIQQIRADVPSHETNHLVAVTFEIFRKWRSRYDHLSDQEKYDVLRTAFQEIDKQSLVHQLDQLVDISAIKGAANEQRQLKGDVERLRKDLEGLRTAQQSANSQKQSNNYIKEIDEIRKALKLKTEQQEEQLKRERDEKQRLQEEMGQIKEMLNAERKQQTQSQPQATKGQPQPKQGQPQQRGREANNIQKEPCITKQVNDPEIMLSNLISAPLKRVKEEKLSNWPFWLKLVRGDLWCCQRDGISIYNLELEKQRHIPQAGMGDIWGVADTGGLIVVAADKGLFAISYDGEHKEKIKPATFRGVCYHQDMIYATCKADSNVYVFESNTWKEIRVIKTDCGANHYHNMTCTRGDIALACRDYDCVYLFNFNGENKRKYGKHGRNVGQFRAPYMCQSDDNNAVLIADYTNARLQLLHDGTWHAVPLQPESPQEPRGAVYIQGVLFVVSSSGNKLIKYEQV